MKKQVQRLDFKCNVRAAQDKQQGIVEGYASVWGVIDGHGSVFTKGCFADSIKSVRGIKIYWNHDYEIPIGRLLEAREDDIGLFVKIKLTTGSERGNDVYELVKDEAVDSMSIGFIVNDDEVIDNVWHINKVDLKEVSLVDVPSNPLAMVTGVRGREEGELALRRLSTEIALLNLNDRLKEELQHVS